MKIIHVTDTSIYNYDGISTYVNELISAAAGQHEILVLTTTPHGATRNAFNADAQVKVHEFSCIRFPDKPKFIITFPWRIKEVIDDFEPDLIWIHTIGTIATRAAKVARNKYNVVYTKHCFDGQLWCTYLNVPKPFQWIFHSVAAKMENKILRVAKNVVYHLNDTSQVSGSEFYDRFIQFPPPLNARFFMNRRERGEFTPRKIKLGFCGRCDPDKGIADTVKALKIFHEKYKDVDFEFMLIGDGPEAHLVKAQNPEMNISITGYVDNVIPYLDQLDGFILSSHHETISLSSLEAYARGIPVFSVPIGYLTENISALDNFYLFRTGEELADLVYNKLVKQVRKTNNIELGNLVISYDKLLLNFV